MQNTKQPKQPFITADILPLLPLRDVVIFPHMVLPLYVGRPKSVKALEQAMTKDKTIFLVTQKEANVNEPNTDDLFQIGTICTVLQLLKMPDGTVKVLVEGFQRGKINRFLPNDDYFLVDVEGHFDDQPRDKEIAALQRAVIKTFQLYAKLSKKITPETQEQVEQTKEISQLADLISSQLSSKLEERQNLLEAFDPTERLQKVYELLEAEMEILQLEKKIRNRVKKQMEKSQKEYYLNEQMQAIQNELGDRDDFSAEIEDLKKQLAEKDMPQEARTKIEKELQKLARMSPMSAESAVVRNYIDWGIQLPWYSFTEDNLDLDRAEQILNEDHYGLEKPKERILEYLAVQSLVKEMRGPILCFVGPPGVGKTSLGRSIARCMDRNFVRLSLGGVRDEAEIRGHRRTYIGAMPGKIIQNIKRAGSGNPVMLLDEVDKLSNDFRGDPSSALLEVLDPEVNNTFNDHYLDLDYDLSRVMFICTANSLQGIPPALRDRMEIIRIAGYTESEKVNIADKFLIPKQKQENGLQNVAINWPLDSTRIIIRRYTREAGVRNLEREIGSVLRKLAKHVASKGKPKSRLKMTEKRIKEYLGIFKFPEKKKEAHNEIGLSTGLAWTEVGGELLNVEVALMPGKGKLIITGKLGEVMQESAQAAMSYVRARAKSFKLDPEFYSKVDIHIHVPEGAMPKDGPSAGITIASALVSALLRIPTRSDVAMTGELTLRGRVLPIGGLKEKALAAYQAECTQVLFPKDNEKDIPEIPEEVRNVITFTPVEHMDQVLQLAFDLPKNTKLFEGELNPDLLDIGYGDTLPLTKTTKAPKTSTHHRIQ